MKRFESLDILRGMSIFGMVFSAIIPYGVLPGWMYHIQNPPPSHTLDITRYGIGWVDLVFPVFIFCMGAAIPFAFRARWAAKGRDTISDLKGIGERFLMLLAFSYLCVLLSPNFDGYWPQYLILGGFVCLWMIYVKKAPAKVRVAGWIAAFALIAVFYFCFGTPLSLFRRNIIILLLSFLYLFGALIWYVTRNSAWRRGVAFLLVIGLSLFTRLTGFDGALYDNKSLSWLFNMEEINFLMILIPATWVGDFFYNMISKGSTPVFGRKISVHVLFWSLLLLVVLVLAGSYLRWQYTLFAVTTVLGTISLLTYKTARICAPPVFLSALLIIVGLAVENLEPGITKVPCSFSYCFVTAGISILLLLWTEYIRQLIPGSFVGRIFSGAGENPLMSYVTFDMLVVPLMSITCMNLLYRWARPLEFPWAGVFTSFIIVMFTMWLVSRASRRKIYWRA